MLNNILFVKKITKRIFCQSKNGPLYIKSLLESLCRNYNAVYRASTISFMQDMIMLFFSGRECCPRSDNSCQISHFFLHKYAIILFILRYD